MKKSGNDGPVAAPLMFEFIKTHEAYEFNLAREKATREAARFGIEQDKAGAQERVPINAGLLEDAASN